MKRGERYLRGSHMVEQGKTVLKMTLVNSAKRARRNLYSTYRKRGTTWRPSVHTRGYPGMHQYRIPSVSVIPFSVTGNTFNN